MTEHYPLFCTAQVPPKVGLSSPFSDNVSILNWSSRSKIINDLLRKSDEGFGNIWTLIKTSSQTTFEKPTEPPVSEFTTSFTNASLDTLSEFCKTHSPSDTTTFAILDERSTKDSTALLVKWEVWTGYINPNPKSGLDDDSNRQQHEEWQTLRVPFGNAAQLMDGLEYLPVQEFNSTEQGFDACGVYTL